MIVLLYLFVSPFFWGQYALVVSSFVPKYRHIEIKNLLKIREPLSVKKNSVMSQRMTHLSMKIVAICGLVVVFVGIALVSVL